MRTTLALLATAAALVAAGCSGDDAPTDTKTEAEAERAAPTKAARFAACMRDHGVTAFPDPDANGELTIDAVANDSPVDISSAAFEQALAACKDLQPLGFTGRKRDAGQQDQALAFAECMRRSGVPDFPDPAPGEPLVNTNRIPSAATSAGMNALNAAMRTCGDKADDLVKRP